MQQKCYVCGMRYGSRGEADECCEPALRTWEKYNELTQKAAKRLGIHPRSYIRVKRPKRFAETLVDLAEEHGLSQKDFFDEVGSTVQVLRHLRSRSRTISAPMACRLVELYGSKLPGLGKWPPDQGDISAPGSPGIFGSTPIKNRDLLAQRLKIAIAFRDRKALCNKLGLTTSAINPYFVCKRALIRHEHMPFFVAIFGTNIPGVTDETEE